MIRDVKKFSRNKEYVLMKNKSEKNFIMSFRKFYSQKFAPWLRRLPYGARLNMALVALSTDLQISNALYPYSFENKYFSDNEIEDVFTGLDVLSIELAKRFMARQIRLPKECFFIHPKYFYTVEEQEEYKKLFPEYKKMCRKFGFPEGKVGVESLYYHHGLRFAPEFVKKNIAGKLFADVGGYWGDSTLVFMNYSPEKVIIFEPLEDCRKKLVRVLNKSEIDPDCYAIHPFALSDKKETLDNLECRPLDDFTANYTTPFGVLKADIEGMGLKFVQGAEKTIRKDRPLLSLAIYHNEHEFAGIYKLLKGWNLDYHFELKQFSPLIPGGELTLFAYPNEWVSKN